MNLLFGALSVGAITYTVVDLIRRLNAALDGPHARGSAVECEREMRRLTNGERGCQAPAEHRRRFMAHKER